MKATWALGLDAKGRPIVNPAAYYDIDPISIFPTGGGAHNWSPMSYSPITGSVYIDVSLSPFTYAATAELKPGTNGYAHGNGTPKLIDSPAIGPPTADGMRGAIEAWDPVNQKLVWRTDGGGGIGGGTVATAGNLVFQVINDGRFPRIDRRQGRSPLRGRNRPHRHQRRPLRYEVDGKQYVAFQGGMGRPASVEGPNNAKVDYPPMMFVFALDGTAELPIAAPAPHATPYSQPPVAPNWRSRAMLRLEATTRLPRLRDDRARVPRQFRRRAAASPGSRFFSNLTLFIGGEVGGTGVAALRDALIATGLNISARSLESLEPYTTTTAVQPVIPFHLVVTFIHTEPDLRIIVPAVPG